MNEWLNQPLGSLDPAVVEQEFKDMYQRAGILANSFGNMAGVARPKGVA